MPLLGFQKRFAPLVESGEKTQTIRAYRKDGRDPKVGDRLYLYTGPYGPERRKIGEVECIGSHRIKFTRKTMEIQNWVTTAHEIAIDDGFSGVPEMLDYFEKTHGLPFKGLLIRWKLDKDPAP